MTLSPSVTEQNKPFFVEKYFSQVVTAFGATALAALATYTAPTEAVRIIGMTVLTGVSYATANDMIACRDCPEYFTVGHFDDGQNLENRPIRTLNPTANALVWGPLASWHVSLIAGTVLSLAARLPIFSATVSANSLAPLLVTGAAVTFCIAHFAARKAESQRLGSFTVLGMNVGLYRGVRKEWQHGWHACNTRNTVGYVAIGLGGAALAAGTIATRIALTIL
ncbi:hypothetical protein N9Y92_03450 [Chlamydiales bacterium]|nr:hypothetical protein [Chlamydiales bacterium]